MEKSISSAFTYMFKDEDWKYKLLILVLLSIPSAFYSLFQLYPEAAKNIFFSPDLSSGIFFTASVVMLIAALFSKGYCLKCIQTISKSNFDEQPELLPRWENNFSEYFKLALLFFVAMIISGVVLLIPFIFVIPALVFYFLMPALYSIFCQDFKVTSFLAWRKAFAIVKQDSGLYLKVIFTYLGIAVVLVIATILCKFISKQIVMVVLPILIAYTELVYAFLYGLIGQNAEIVSEFEE